MTTTDLYVLVRVVHANSHNQRPVCPGPGENTAATRLEKSGFLCRDSTRTLKPYAYCPTDEGFKVANALASLLGALGARIRPGRDDEPDRLEVSDQMHILG